MAALGLKASDPSYSGSYIITNLQRIMCNDLIEITAAKAGICDSNIVDKFAENLKKCSEDDVRGSLEYAAKR